jgi:hypothetical protein
LASFRAQALNRKDAKDAKNDTEGSEQEETENAEKKFSVASFQLPVTTTRAAWVRSDKRP